MQVLVTYYSRTGHTRKVGEALAKELNCDAEEIIDTADRSGPKGFIMSGRQVEKKELTKLRPITKDPAQYDIVIIGTPVWVLTMATPVRTYILENKIKFKKVAFFATAGKIGIESTLKDMGELCGKKAEGTFGVTAAEISSGRYVEGIKKITGELKLEKEKT